ncbi:zinc metalloproteinase-disintegrin-like MTP8 isoform X2 [Diachasmimorpha longicaudata]
MIYDTRINNDYHLEALTIELEIDGVQRTLDLKLNKDLIPVGYKQITQDERRDAVEEPQVVELCHYQGSLQGFPSSWAALSTCEGLRGVIHNTQDLHFIHPHEDTLNAIHYLYKHSDFSPNRTYLSSPSNPQALRTRRALHPNVEPLLRVPYLANSGSRYLELVFVADTSLYERLERNVQRVHRRVKDIVNIINALYTPLNIFVALVGIEVWTMWNKIDVSPSSASTLKNFMKYRKQDLLKRMPNDNSQLLTGIVFDDKIVGKAGVGTMCTEDSSGGVNMDHSAITGLVAATVAHEIGHNFGMNHDTRYCRCPEEECIMSEALTTKAPTHWSSCSLEQLALGFARGVDTCLRNSPRSIFGKSECGNGFLETGEECDCGLQGHCDNKCCDPTTCRFTSGATCATGECCDLTTCRLKPPGLPCRASSHECDLPEFCTGNSEYCPQDIYKMDGYPCSMETAFCYRGSCSTHDEQCSYLWGPSGHSSSLPCYELNVNGNSSGNCGYDFTSSTYDSCRNADIFCGRLQCNHLSAEMTFQFAAYAAVTAQTYVYGVGPSVLSCKTAMLDVGGRKLDPGLVPNGAKCAEGRMCVDQACLDVQDVIRRINRDSACLRNCSGNGVCNSLGRCHCDDGFRPPDCALSGSGGSQDSGRTDTGDDEINGVAIALYVIFLGILPVVAISLLCIWHKRNRSSSNGTKIFLSMYISSRKYLERLRRILTPQRMPHPDREPPKVFTISDRVTPNRLTITRMTFVSATNPEVIRSSRNLRIPRSPGVEDSNDRLTTPPVVSIGRKSQGSTANCDHRRGNRDEIPSGSSPRQMAPEGSQDSGCVYESNSELYLAFKKVRSRTPEQSTNVHESEDFRPNGKFFYSKKPPPPPIL